MTLGKSNVKLLINLYMSKNLLSLKSTTFENRVWSSILHAYAKLMMTQNVRRIGVADASCKASCWSYRIFSYGVEGNVQCPRNSYSKVEDDLFVAIQLARVFEFDVRNDSNGSSERFRARRSATAVLCMPWLCTFYSISLSCHTSNVFSRIVC